MLIFLALPTEQPTIRRLALGRYAKVGDLYDIRSDSVLSPTIYNQSIPDGCFRVDTLPGDTVVKVVETNKTEDKFNILELDEDLQLSFLLGMTPAEGSARYLNDNNALSAVFYQYWSASESIDFYTREMPQGYLNCISKRELQATSATHVISEIIWGNNLIIARNTTDDAEKMSKNDMKRAEAEQTGDFTKILQIRKKPRKKTAEEQLYGKCERLVGI